MDVLFINSRQESERFFPDLFVLSVSGLPVQFEPVLKSLLPGSSTHVASAARATVVGSAADAKAEVASRMARSEARRRAARSLLM